jgi:hypothetical protein
MKTNIKTLGALSALAFSLTVPSAFAGEVHCLALEVCPVTPELVIVDNSTYVTKNYTSNITNVTNKTYVTNVLQDNNAVAMALAVSASTQASQEGLSINAGLSQYKNTTAFALGVSKNLTDKFKVNFNAVKANTSKVGYAVGASFKF